MGKQNKREFRSKWFIWLLVTAVMASMIPYGPSAAQAEPAAAPVQLKETAAGSIISYGGRDWLLLDPAEGFVLAKNKEGGERQFDPDGTLQFDAEDANNIGYWLNDETGGYASSLEAEGANLAWITNHNWDIGPYDDESSLSASDIKIALLGRLDWHQYQSLIEPYLATAAFSNELFWLRNTAGFSQTGLLLCLNDYISKRCDISALNPDYISNVRPVMHLNSDLHVASGDGSSGTPYVLTDRTNADASSLSVTSASIVADGVSFATVTVTLVGVFSPIEGHAVSLAKDAGSSTISPETAVTNAAGDAVFTVTNTKAETVTYTAADITDNVTVTETIAVTFEPGEADAAQSTLSASLTSLVADGTASSSLTVAIKDANGNPIPGHTVSLAKGGGSSMISPETAVTNADGEAVFTVTNTKAETVTYTATDMTDNVTVTETAAVAFMHGEADDIQSTLTASLTSLVADGTASSSLTVAIKDENGNSIPGHNISLAQGAGRSIISPASATTNADGKAVFTVTSKRAGAVTYTATDTTAGMTAAETATVTFTAKPASPVITEPEPVIDLNGTPFDPDTIDLSEPSVTLEPTPKDGAASVTIPAAVLSGFGQQNASFFIEIKTPYGSYRIPVNLASLIPGLQSLLAANGLNAEDVSFKITLTDMSGSKDIQGAFAGGLPNGTVMGAIVDFRIDIVNVNTGQTIGTADQFSKPLARMIPMPNNVAEIPEQWGAFRYNEAAGQFRFAAAKAVRIDGVWYAMISSYSNSVYVVAENNVGFTDMTGHWANSYVSLASAKGLISGVGGGLFDPAKAVTRAEFTAMLVRALGRGASVSAAAPYDDVKAGAWYYAEAAKAKELGLLRFASGNAFLPDQPLTREEMASMLASVARLEQLPMTLEYTTLDGYNDIGSVNEAYLEDVRLMVKLRIMTGTSADTFSPQGGATRAQAAIVLVKALQAFGSIN